MADSLVPQLQGETLDDYLTRAHSMVMKLGSGACLLVEYGEASLPIFPWSGSAAEIPSILAQIKQKLLDLKAQVATLPLIFFSPSSKQGWSETVVAAADMARRLSCTVVYCYGPLEVNIYPWHSGQTAALCSKIMRLAHRIGVTMERC